MGDQATKIPPSLFLHFIPLSPTIPALADDLKRDTVSTTSKEGKETKPSPWNGERGESKCWKHTLSSPLLKVPKVQTDP